MGRKLVDDDLADRHDADAAARLGRDELLGSAIPLALDPNGPAQEVDVADLQRALPRSWSAADRGWSPRRTSGTASSGSAVGPPGTNRGASTCDAAPMTGRPRSTARRAEARRLPQRLGLSRPSTTFRGSAAPLERPSPHLPSRPACGAPKARSGNDPAASKSRPPPPAPPAGGVGRSPHPLLHPERVRPCLTTSCSRGVLQRKSS